MNSPKILESNYKIAAKVYPIPLKAARVAFKKLNDKLNTNKSRINEDDFSDEQLKLICFSQCWLAFESFLNFLLSILNRDIEKEHYLTARFSKLTEFFKNVRFEEIKFSTEASQEEFNSLKKEINRLIKKVNKEINNDINGNRSNIKRANIFHGRVQTHSETKEHKSSKECDDAKMDFFMSDVITDFYLNGLNVDTIDEFLHLIDNFIKKIHQFFKLFINQFSLTQISDNSQDKLTRLSLLNLFIHQPYDFEDKIVSSGSTVNNKT